MGDNLVQMRECRGRGGHCWTSDGSLMRNMAGTFYHEWCKHCPAKRDGRSREAVEWTCPDGQP